MVIFRTIESTLYHDPEVQDFPGLRKILAAQQNNKDIVVACKLCFDDEMKPLRDCLATCYKKQVSNAKTHLRYRHPDVLKSLEDDKKKEFPDDMEQEEVPLPVYKQKNLVVQSPKDVLNNLHYLIYRFINDCGVSARIGTDNKLYDIIHYAMQHSTLLAKNNSIVMRAQHFNNIQLTSFAGMVSYISNVVIKTRGCYKEHTGNNQRFLNVAHDIWDAKNKKIMGVSLYFIALLDWKYLQIPVGLLPSVGKSADVCAEQIQNIISCYGVGTAGVFASVNDTTNSAVKTGENILGKKGSCGMHTVDLSMEHATGQAKRTKSCVMIIPCIAKLQQGKRTFLQFVPGKKRLESDCGISCRFEGSLQAVNECADQKSSLHFGCIL